MKATTEAPCPESRSNAVRDYTTATERPCSVMSYGPSISARLTTSDNLALASCICRVCMLSSASD
jgi:hypothetical protein